MGIYINCVLLWDGNLYHLCSSVRWEFVSTAFFCEMGIYIYCVLLWDGNLYQLCSSLRWEFNFIYVQMRQMWFFKGWKNLPRIPPFGLLLSLHIIHAIACLWCGNNLLNPTGFLRKMVEQLRIIYSAHTILICFVFISEQTANSATYYINWWMCNNFSKERRNSLMMIWKDRNMSE